MDLDAVYAQCADVVRTNDPDRYLTALTAEPADRGPLLCLYAFYNEIARARDATYELHLAAIRLQWWRDALEDLASGNTPDHPIAAGLKHLIEQGRFGVADLAPIIDAYEDDLEDPLISTWDDLDAWCDRTAGALMALALKVLGAPNTEIAKLGGRAWGIMGTVRAFPHHAGAGRIYLPAEAFGDVDLDPHQVFQGEGGLPMMAIMLAAIGRAQDYEHLLRDEARGSAKSARPAFSYVSLIDLYVTQIRRRHDAPYALHPDIPNFRKQWRLLTTTLRG